jgi:hypothetical protein
MPVKRLVVGQPGTDGAMPAAIELAARFGAKLSSRKKSCTAYS